MTSLLDNKDINILKITNNYDVYRTQPSLGWGQHTFGAHTFFSSFLFFAGTLLFSLYYLRLDLSHTWSHAAATPHPPFYTHTHTQVTDTSFSPVIYSPILLCNSCFSCPPSLHHEGESYFLPPLLTHLI